MNSTPLPSAPPKKHRNLAQGVVAHISDTIRSGELKPGDKLPTESEIMRILGVSRTVVREAISHLQAAALVETRHGIGTFVLEPPPPCLASNARLAVRDVLKPRLEGRHQPCWYVVRRRLAVRPHARSIEARNRGDVTLGPSPLSLHSRPA